MLSVVRSHPTRSVLYRTMRLLEGANVFCLMSLLLVAGLFVLGNFQEFLDQSQLMLLSIVSVLSVLCIASGFCYVIALTIWMVRRRRSMMLRLFYGLLSTLMGGIAAAIAGALETIVRPV